MITLAIILNLEDICSVRTGTRCSTTLREWISEFWAKNLLMDDVLVLGPVASHEYPRVLLW